MSDDWRLEDARRQTIDEHLMKISYGFAEASAVIQELGIQPSSHGSDDKALWGAIRTHANTLRMTEVNDGLGGIHPRIMAISRSVSDLVKLVALLRRFVGKLPVMPDGVTVKIELHNYNWNICLLDSPTLNDIIRKTAPGDFDIPCVEVAEEGVLIGKTDGYHVGIANEVHSWDSDIWGELVKMCGVK